jgi:hypothetical protein
MQRQSLLNKDIDVLLEMIISHAEGEENAETKFVRHLISN